MVILIILSKIKKQISSVFDNKSIEERAIFTGENR